MKKLLAQLCINENAPWNGITPFGQVFFFGVGFLVMIGIFVTQGAPLKYSLFAALIAHGLLNLFEAFELKSISQKD